MVDLTGPQPALVGTFDPGRCRFTRHHDRHRLLEAIRDLTELAAGRVLTAHDQGRLLEVLAAARTTADHLDAAPRLAVSR